MVRINLIEPKKLADQHLVAEYNEILMLLGYVSKYPDIEDIPAEFTLGKGHIKFFKDKLIYLKKRHELIKTEMRNRKFSTNKTINLNEFKAELHNDWVPQKKDIDAIKKRLLQKIDMKPEFYRYYGEHKNKGFFISLLNS